MSTHRVFDIDAIMRDVRVAANLCPAATTATLLQNHPNRSDVAIVADDHAAEIEERAGLAADRIPPVYLDVWARINHQKPSSVSEAEWRLALDDGGQFLDAWGADAATRWMAGELFDVPRDGRPGGLVWQLKGERVGTLGEDRARLTHGA
jgi:hypothetical protein